MPFGASTTVDSSVCGYIGGCARRPLTDWLAGDGRIPDGVTGCEGAGWAAAVAGPDRVWPGHHPCGVLPRRGHRRAPSAFFDQAPVRPQPTARNMRLRGMGVRVAEARGAGRGQYSDQPTNLCPLLFANPTAYTIVN